MKRYRLKKERIYALYKGDQFLMTGTGEECAEYLEVNRRYITYISTPSYHRRSDGNRVLAYKLGYEKVEEEDGQRQIHSTI